MLSVAAIAGGGCAPRLLSFDEPEPAQFRQILGAPPANDGRPHFRQIVCLLCEKRRTPQRPSLKCEDILWHLPDETPPPPLPSPLPAHDLRLRILIVPGAFAECFPEYGMPFEAAAKRLQAIGYRIGFIPVSGRGGADFNADEIANALRLQPTDPDEKIVLIGHSKGVVDILHFVANHPLTAERIASVVGVSGPVSGSPLADGLSGVYARLFSRMPLKDCPPADRDVLDSLKRSRQMNWLASHPLPAHIAYFSLVTFARRQDIHPLMQFGYDLLAASDPRNDGYVLWSDQVIPGSTVLAYVALDHYDVALPVREKLNIGGLYGREDFRDVLLEAIVLSVAEALNRR